MATRPSAPTRAVAVVQAAGVDHVLYAFEHDAAAESFGAEVTEALGVELARVHKTLMVDTGESLAVGIVSADRRLDLKAVAASLGARKVQMADARVAERRTGYVLGGISPLGQTHRHRTVLDEAAMAFETILVSGGRRGLEIELAPADLVRLTDAVVAPISR